jgi:hypothetical protein
MYVELKNGFLMWITGTMSTRLFVFSPMNAQPQIVIDVSKLQPIAETNQKNMSHIPRRVPTLSIPISHPEVDPSESYTYVSIVSDYAAKNAGELSLEEMDIVRIYPTKTTEGMVFGTFNDQRGWFPENITRSLTEEEVLQEGLLQVEEKQALSRTASQSQVNGNQKWYSKFIRPESKSNLDLQSVPEKEPLKSKRQRDRAPGQRLLWADFVGKEQVEKLNLSKEEIKRQEVIFEIITTEEDYVEDLELILNLYIRPLEKNKLIRTKDMSIIFSNIEQVLPVNQELLRSLDEQQQRNPVIDSVGEILIRVSDYLKMYTMYCSNHPYALMKLQSVRQNKPVAKFMDSVQMMPQSCKMDLSHFLLKPIQRVCKYPLFVRELLRYTKQDHPDHEALHRALLKIEAVVTTINEGARHTENVHKMIELQSKFLTKVSLITPSRVLKKSMQIESFNGNGDRRKREVYVFNDMLVVTKPEGDKYKLLSMISFDTITIHLPKSDFEEASSKDSSHSKEGDWSVEVGSSGKDRVRFMFETQDKRSSWIQLVQDYVDEYVAQKQRILQANGVQSGGPTPTSTSFPDDSPTPTKTRATSAVVGNSKSPLKTDLPPLPKLSPITLDRENRDPEAPASPTPTNSSHHDVTPTSNTKIPTPFIQMPKVQVQTEQPHQRASTAPALVAPVPPPRLKTPIRTVMESGGEQGGSNTSLEHVILKPTPKYNTATAPPTAPTSRPSSALSEHSSHTTTSYQSKIPVKKPTIISKPISKATVLCVNRCNPLHNANSSSNTSVNSIHSTHSLGGTFP